MYPVYTGSARKEFQGLCQIVNVFQNKDVGIAFAFRNKKENSFSSIVEDVFSFFKCLNNE